MDNYRLIAKLYMIATGDIKHSHNGLCPGSNKGPYSRDPSCEACIVLIDYDKMVCERLNQINTYGG